MLPCFTLLILLLSSLTKSLKLGVIDEFENLEGLCQAALEEAKQNSDCVSDPIE